jgi:glycosyltransferase involved in cell wall biosynthesis
MRVVVVQNEDDRAFVAGLGIVPEKRVVLVPGSGVETGRFAPAPEPEGVPVVLFPSRLLRDKGVEEFVAAARLLRARGVAARFVLVGDRDPENPASVPAQTLHAWTNEGVVEHWGWRDDMPAVYAQASVVCLPSWREGMSRALLEAAACGRAIVTCDVPGCRDVVADGAGVLVPARDPQALAQALATLLADPAKRQALGVRARARALAEFSLERVVRDTLAIYAVGVEHASAADAR